MKTKKNTIKSLLATLAVSATISGVANAVIIISDDFSNSGPINGSTADTGQTWTASSGFNAAISLGIMDSDYTASISGLTLQTNCVYTFSMDMNVTEGGSDAWIGMGFKTTSFANLTSGTVGAFLHRPTPAVQMFSQNGANSQSAAAQTGQQQMEIILQTGNTLSNSTVSWKVDGAQVGSSRATNASSVDGIFFQGGFDGRGTVDNLVLSHDAVPEPSSTMLFGLGGLALIFRRRRIG